MNNLHKKWIISCFAILLLSCSTEAEYVPIDDRLDAIPEGVENLNSLQVNLGRFLFWDPILSGNRTVSCATCHHPNHGWADGRELAMGMGGIGLGPERSGGEVINRNSPTILNTAFNGITANGSFDPDTAPMFWDNRVSSLESQAKEPILSAKEMRGIAYSQEVAIDSIIQRLNAIGEYVDLFNHAYSNGITEENILNAIAQFERSIVGKNSSRFDRYVKGDLDALSTRELRGLEAFNTNKCINCHSGPMFSDYKLHAIGVPENPLLNSIDNGDGQFRFRTPTLRNLVYTAPYMHNGTMKTLEDAINFYEDIGDGVSNNPNVSSDMLSSKLNGVDVDEADVALIMEFLLTLTDNGFETTIPERVPSGLTVGGD